MDCKYQVLAVLLLLLLLAALWTWSPALFCALAVLPPVTIMWIEPKVPKRRHVLQFALTIFLGRVNIFQCEAVFRNHCFAERFGPQICHVFLTLDSSRSQPLRSDFILHQQVRHVSVFQSTNSLSVDDVFGGLRIDGQHWLHLVTQILQQRRNSF